MLTFSRFVGRGPKPSAPVLNPPVVNDDTFSMPTSGAGWTAGMLVGTMTATNSPTSWAITAGDASDHFDIASNGNITVTAAGIAALDGATGSVALTVQATNADGSDTGTVTIDYEPAAAASAIPMSFDDERFLSNTQETTYRTYYDPLSASRTFTNKDWDARPTMWEANPDPENDPLGNQFLQCDFNSGMVVTCNQCRGYWREGFRVNGSGPNAKLVLNECYIQVMGIWHPVTNEDHADGVQAFCENVAIEVNNSVFRCCDDNNAAIQIQPPPSGQVTGYGSDAFRWADNSSGSIKFLNVIIRGDGRGVSIWADQGTTTIDFENVYFIDEDPTASLPDAGSGEPGARQNYRYSMGENGGALVVANWTNVRLATIVGGEIIPGDLLPPP